MRALNPWHGPCSECNPETSQEQAMKIEQASVSMNATHDYFHESGIESSTSFRTVLSAASQEVPETGSERDERVRLLLLLQSLVSQMLEIISGKQGGQRTDPGALSAQESPAPAVSRASGAGRGVRMEWGTELRETIHEQESTNFSASGTVRTADGRALDFTLELGMCRDFSSTRTIRQSGSLELRDPLVLNFDGCAAELSGQRFAFDLDVDGISELIPGLAAGSAWLAFDRNADGRINDGRELFGALSGDGFADLAAFDTDGNRWLDEADAMFSSLSLWQRDGAGADTLSTLREKGVGAIYLGNVGTPFGLAGSDNEKLGYIRSSGLYLSEDGGIGSVQQVDLAV